MPASVGRSIRVKRERAPPDREEYWQAWPPLRGELLILTFRVGVGLLFGDPASTIQHVAVIELQKGIQFLDSFLPEDRFPLL